MLFSSFYGNLFELTGEAYEVVSPAWISPEFRAVIPPASVLVWIWPYKIMSVAILAMTEISVVKVSVAKVSVKKISVKVGITSTVIASHFNHSFLYNKIYAKTEIW